MKKVVLILAAAAVFVACSNSKKSAVEVESLAPVEGTLPIAVVNVDSILKQYTLAVEANENLLKKQEDARLKINTKARQLQNEMVDFQRKLENNAFLSRERAEQEGRRLQQKESDLQELDQKLTQDLLVEQQDLSMQLRDSIDAAIKVLNADGKYQMIVSTSSLNDNVLYVQPENDITGAIIEYLNANYKK